jgi:hypothetical protein
MPQFASEHPKRTFHLTSREAQPRSVPSTTPTEAPKHFESLPSAITGPLTDAERELFEFVSKLAA